MVESILGLNPIIVLIMLASCWTWYLLLQLYFSQQAMFSVVRPLINKGINHQPDGCAEQVYSTHVESMTISKQRQASLRGISTVNVLIKVIPMLGLLGTIDGMITSFETLSDNNTQEQLSGGISQALMTTLAGLVAALSAMYFSYHLKRRSDKLLTTTRQYFQSLQRGM